MNLTLRQLFDNPKQILPWSDPLNKDAYLRVFGWSSKSWNFKHWRSLIKVCYVFRVKRLEFAKGDGEDELNDLANFIQYRGLYDLLEFPGQNGLIRLPEYPARIFLHDLEIVGVCAANYSLPRGLKALLNASRARKLIIYLEYREVRPEHQLSNILDHIRRNKLIERNYNMVEFSAFTWNGKPIWPDKLTDQTKFDCVRNVSGRNKKRANCLRAVVTLLGLKRLGWRKIERDAMSIIVGILWSTKEQTEW